MKAAPPGDDMKDSKKKKDGEGEGGGARLKTKQYEKEMRKLQVELCHLQEWV